MRVGIDYRILAVGPGLIGRGMPRYTQQQLRAVLRIDADNEYVLLTNPEDDLTLIDPEVRTAPNVVVRSFPGTANPRYPAQGNPTTLLRRAEEYQEWIWAQGIDLYHATNPFLLHEPVLTDFDACPVVATFYDVIPLVFPDHYLRQWAANDEYLRTMMFLEKAGRLISISEWSRRDALYYLGIPTGRIDVAWPVADPWFLPLTPGATEAGLATLRRRARVPESFVLTVTHLHHSKNLRTLLSAYALLPSPLRVLQPLVVACAFDKASDHAAKVLVEELGVADDVIFTGLVTNAELAALYNAATLLVHPSRYEGFGLPVVEAMQCGTPVITTTASSLPEVAGDAAVLVDSEDAAALAEAIADLASDADRRQTLSRCGPDRARRFDAGQLGRRTLDCYQRTLRENAGTEPALPRRLRVALWAPLPPQPTGVAGFSADLAEGLAERAQVEIFVDDEVLPDLPLLRRHRVHHHRGFERRRRQAPFDAVIYELGGHRSHLFAYRAMSAYPGVADLHDLTLSHLLFSLARDTGDLERFAVELGAVEGEDARKELEDIRPGSPDFDARLSELLFRFPMLGGVLAHSIAQVVHYEHARSELTIRYPGSRVYTVPLGVAWRRGLRPGAERLLARDRLEIGEGTFVVGAFGVAHPFKRLASCIRALAAIAGRCPDSMLVIVGEVCSDTYRLELGTLAHELGVGGRVRFTGRVDDDIFDDHLVASDVVANLRDPFMKQMSATLLRSLAAGRPVLITDVPAWSQIPGDCSVRIPTGSGEVDGLSAALLSLAVDPELRLQMSHAARRHYEKEATIETLATRYLEVIEASLTDTGSVRSGR